MNNHRLFFLLLSLFTSISSQVFAQAASNANAGPNYKQVLSQGYDIRAVTFLSDTVSTQLAGSNTSDTILVTLQKGDSVATCWFTLKAWLSQNIGTDPCTIGPL